MRFLVRHTIPAALLIGLQACMPTPVPTQRIPSLEYSERIKEDYALRNPEYRARLEQEKLLRAERDAALLPASGQNGQARLKLIGGDADSDTSMPVADGFNAGETGSVVTNLGADADGGAAADSGYKVYRSSQPDIRDYNGPLSLGDPGLSASLWRESSASTNLFRDYRAWQPMDLITILVSENSEGKNKADTTIKQESTIAAAISNFLGLENYLKQMNKDVDLEHLISADSKHDYKGEGETKRTGTLRANISAMVMEVLPSGVLRIEGEKIIVVNNDDEIMRISGLVRPEDVNSRNEIDSSKVANVRIDYYGKGSVGNAQTGGWLGNFIRKMWPL